MANIYGRSRIRVTRAAAAITMAAGIAAMVSIPGAGASNVAPHGLRTHDAKVSTNGGNLVDHGGKALPSSDTYLIFWGPSSGWSSDVESGIQSLFQGFNGSNYLGIAKQYMRGASISTSYKGTALDPSLPPSKVNASTLGNEVIKEFGSNVDLNGVYLVYTSNFPRGGNFCAWHSLTSTSAGAISVAYMPNTANVAGCDPGNLYGTSGSEGLRSLANVSAHEFMESVTDALPASGTYGWIDAKGNEIGDKCAWQFSAAVTLPNHTDWQLQKEWDNSITGCNQGT